MSFLDKYWICSDRIGILNDSIYPINKTTMIKSFKELRVWQEAINLVTDVYRATQQFPKQEMYGLTDQVRRASVSVPSNIAEGQQRGSTRQYLYFLSIARGSLGEVETQIILGYRLGYINAETEKRLSDKILQVGGMLGGLMKALRARVK